MWTNEPVSIGAGSWLGHGAIVLPGSRIGGHVVVAGGAVVAGGEIPDFSVVAGCRRASCALRPGCRLATDRRCRRARRSCSASRSARGASGPAARPPSGYSEIPLCECGERGLHRDQGEHAGALLRRQLRPLLSRPEHAVTVAATRVGGVRGRTGLPDPEEVGAGADADQPSASITGRCSTCSSTIR